MKRCWALCRGLGAAALLVAGLCAPGAFAAAAEVTAEAGDRFDQLRFAWPSRVQYTAQRFGNELLIEFAAPVDGDVAAAAGALGGFIASARLDAGGREVVVRLTGSHRLRTYRDGNDVVIDVGAVEAVSNSRPAVGTGAAGATKSSPETGPRLAVRLGEHPTYRRMVFDWRSKTPYTVTEADGVARIAFGRPARIDTAALATRLPDAFSGLRSERGVDGNTDVVIPIPDGVRVRHFLSGTKVVVDLIQDPAARSPVAASPKETAAISAAKTAPAPTPKPAPAAPASPSEEEVAAAAKTELASKFGLAPSQKPEKASPPEPLAPGKAPAKVTTKPTDTRQSPAPTVTPAPSPPKATPAPAPAVTAAAAAVPVQAASAASAGPTPVASTAPAPSGSVPASAIPPASVVATNAVGGGATSAANAAEVPSATVPRNASAADGSTPRASDQGVASADNAAVTDVPEDDTESLVASLRASENATITGPLLPVMMSRTNDATSLRFDWKASAAAAVFLRAEHLWVVFDQPVTFDLTQLLANPGQIMGRPEQIAVAPGSALRIPLVAGIAPRVWRDGEAWVVDLRPQAMRPDVALTVGTQQSSPQGPRVFVLAEGVGRTIVARDPEVGDLLFMVPLTPLSRGIEAERRYSQFNLLGSVQGLVVQPLIDELEVRILPDGVAITASKLSGLEVSKPLPGKTNEELVGRRGDGLPPGLAPGRIFNLVSWRQGAREADFLNVKQEIQRQISEATSISRSGPRLSLAQFYFANGLAAEAMGLLRTISTSDEELARRPDVKALRGASQFMLGRFAEAETDLDDRSLNGFAEAELWRGASNAAQGKWANAIEHFARAGEVPGGYPRNFATQLAMLAAEAAIRAGDFRGAGGFLDAIAEGRPTPGEQARLDYLRGRVLYASGDVDTALDYWRRLSRGDDRWSRVRAKRALIEHNLRENSITRIEAIEDLESLRFTWRGGQLEFDLLRRLGNLYIEEKDYVAGLEALRQAVIFFPNNLFARAVSKEMTEQFAKIYTDGIADAMTPLTALSLYDQFRELTPVGRRGDAIIQRLADRLVQVDLLDRASILLDRQVRFRLQGVSKARVGSRLALIRLLDRQPEKALEALDESVAPGLDRKLAVQRKRLRARGIFELGDSETALKLLKPDPSRDAGLLRADIYWRTQDWAKAAKVFEELVGQSGRDGRRIDDRAATLVLNWAVTLSLTDDFNQLNKVRQIYTQQMDSTSYREAFRLITNRTEGELKDFRTLTARFEEIGRFQAFLTSYRDKLKDQPLSAVN
jgi:tetratricopeptide (TPR) repeat protein